jgi:2-polyprenyl-6-methoxyphenol hydroxylase-like FAD-dependent oxidoreductase
VRELAGIAFTGGSYPQTFVLADVEADGLEPGAAHVFLSGQGMLFFFPLVTPATWRLLVVRPKSNPTLPDAAATLDDVQTLADDYTAGSVRLRDPVWTTNFRVHHRAAAHYRNGRIFIAGDAARIHSPAGAQGMNTASVTENQRVCTRHWPPPDGICCYADRRSGGPASSSCARVNTPRSAFTI